MQNDFSFNDDKGKIITSGLKNISNYRSKIDFITNNIIVKYIVRFILII